uniref:NADH dehydrogenase subunit 6 n=1 Tax=Alectorobius fonsecai TaxID=656181 RepID=UPI002238C03A|nr:NADH dehydrogenase subunit 6 [Alectorobius fonsecai]UYB78311.1 NADH dehydrogenase subunit 6 [Alectorobius fonsecai]UYL27220.1 NADH dehydrogenase subunit 6 [Alectorobius fonsecai]
MKLILFMITCFISSSHPISMIIMIILISLSINMYMYMHMKFSWFIMIITLLILGGLMVIFLYITSLTPNKKFNFNKKFLLMTALLIFFSKTNQMMNSCHKSQIMNMFYPESLVTLILTLIFLMLTLISIMWLINSSMAPIKSN